LFIFLVHHYNSSFPSFFDCFLSLFLPQLDIARSAQSGVNAEFRQDDELQQQPQRENTDDDNY